MIISARFENVTVDDVERMLRAGDILNVTDGLQAAIERQFAPQLLPALSSVALPPHRGRDRMQAFGLMCTVACSRIDATGQSALRHLRRLTQLETDRTCRRTAEAFLARAERAQAGAHA